MNSFLLLVILLTFGINADKKVNVTVYIESYCPCSGDFQYLFQKYITNTTIGSIVDLNRYWDGKAHSNGNVTCFHGEPECLANQLNECVQNMTSSWQLWLNYTVCINGECSMPKTDVPLCEHQYEIGWNAGLKIEQECAKKYNLNWDEINKCSKSKDGLHLLWLSALHGNEAGEEYGIQGLPVVWVNNTLFSTFWNCDSWYNTKMVPLVQEICNVYKSFNQGPLPPDCPH